MVRSGETVGWFSGFWVWSDVLEERERGDEVGRERMGMAKARNSGFSSGSRVSGLGKQGKKEREEERENEGDGAFKLNRRSGFLIAGPVWFFFS